MLRRLFPGMQSRPATIVTKPREDSSRIGYFVQQIRLKDCPTVYRPGFVYYEWPSRWRLGKLLNPTRQFKSYDDAVAYAEKWFLHNKVPTHWIYIGHIADVAGPIKAKQSRQYTYKTGRYYSIAKRGRKR